MHNNLASGFTLLEMCLILCVISIFLVLTPVQLKSSAILKFESERLAALIKRAQGIAIYERREVNVEIKRNGILIDTNFHGIDSSVICDEYIFYFNGKGNINMANTINCYYQGKLKQIVMNLGNGNIYVK